MADLKIPFAVDDAEQLWRPKDASRGHRYRCPECLDPVSLHRSRPVLGQAEPLRADHFQHLREHVCSLESVIHAAAKYEIAWRVKRWCSGAGEPPLLARMCVARLASDCHHHAAFDLLPDNVTGALVERGLAVIARRPDVTLHDAGMRPLLAVEIYFTNQKPEDYGEFPFVELDANEVLADPLRWRPCRSERWLDSHVCPPCVRQQDEHERGRADARAAQEGAQLGRQWTAADKAHRQRTADDEYDRKVAELRRRMDAERVQADPVEEQLHRLRLQKARRTTEKGEGPTGDDSKQEELVQLELAGVGPDRDRR